MKACVLHKPGRAEHRPLRFTDVAAPRPGPDEIRVSVSACGVCRTDLHIVEGDLPTRKTPVIPGHQVVGHVDAMGNDVRGFALGDRVGIAWLRATCRSCSFCDTGKENLCDDARFTGWTDHGGYAEFAVAPSQFVYALPEALDDAATAPLLCAGIIGYRCLRHCGVDDWSGAKLGIYGFGAAGHIAIQLALHRGAKVYVFTRDSGTHQKLADTLGATWIGKPDEQAPTRLDASIVFAPAGEIVPPALRSLAKGATLVLGGIHMSPIPQFDYAALYGERRIRTVTNNTRDDGDAFLVEAALAGVKTHVRKYPLEYANEALVELKTGAIRGAAVLTV